MKLLLVICRLQASTQPEMIRRNSRLPLDKFVLQINGKNYPKSHLKQPSAITSLFQTFKLKPGGHIPRGELSSFFSGVPAILSSGLTLFLGSTEALPSAATRNISRAAHIQSPRPALSSSLPLDHRLPPPTDFIDYPTQL